MLPGTVHRLTSRHLSLDAAQSGLIAAQQFRTVAVTAHRPRSEWTWAGSEDSPAMTAVIFPTGGSFRFGERGAAKPISTNAGLLLHSSHAASIDWNPGAAGTVVWLETHSVLENGVSEASAPIELTANALASGFRAFAEAAVQGASMTSGVSTYFVERLLLEMALGIVMEGMKANVAGAAAERPIQRARTLMLLHRHNPHYGVDDLAHDLHMSLRQLQRVFAAEGTTPASALRLLRVELAESLLSDPTYDVLSIPLIAEHSGFANATNLRRALRDHGHLTPRVMRDRE